VKRRGNCLGGGIALYGNRACTISCHTQGKDSNYSFVMISGEASRFGMYDMKIEDRKTESLLNIRGDRDRTYGDMVTD